MYQNKHDVTDQLNKVCQILERYGKRNGCLLKASNFCFTVDTTLSMSFIQVPDSPRLLGVDTTLITMSILSSGELAVAIPKPQFHRLCTSVERTLLVVGDKYSDSHGEHPGYYDSLWNKSDIRCFSCLECQRAFIVLTDSIAEIESSLFCKNKVRLYKSLGISDIAVTENVANMYAVKQYFV